MARLTVHLPGTFHVSVQGVPMAGLQSELPRAVPSYQAVELDRKNRRQSLAGHLWPGFLERRVWRDLGRALLNIRGVMGDRIAHSARTLTADGRARTPFLGVTRQTIRLSSVAETWVGVEELADCHAAGGGGAGRWRPSLENPVESCRSENLERSEQIEALYRGRSMDSLSLAGPSSAHLEHIHNRGAVTDKRRCGLASSSGRHTD